VIDVTRPHRLLVAAIEDLHALADGVRRLVGRGDDLERLLESVFALPEVEERLATRIEELMRDVSTLAEAMPSLSEKVVDLDRTAEQLAGELAAVQGQIVELRDRIPGI
jgi:chromosome segregation ATPase